MLLTACDGQAHNHTLVTDSAVAATCKTTGLTEGSHCSECGFVLFQQVETPIIDHFAEDWIIDKEATKTEDGSRHGVCIMCGQMVEEVLYATGSIGLAYIGNGDGTCFVSGIGSCTDDEIIIPRYIEKNLVTGIGGHAFEDVKSLRSVLIPDSVIDIGAFAFAQTSLTNISIPDSVTNIGSGAFSGCESLTDVVLSNSIESLDYMVFRWCTSLTNITIPDSVTYIDSAFYWCTSLKSITIPDSVTRIGSEAFYNCKSLTDVTLGDSVESIGKSAFYSCTSLEKINIPSSVIYIGESAFVGVALNSLVIPNSVETIRPCAFQACNQLTIYCEAASQPNGWDPVWNFSNCPVVWGYKISK